MARNLMWRAVPCRKTASAGIATDNDAAFILTRPHLASWLAMTWPWHVIKRPQHTPKRGQSRGWQTQAALQVFAGVWVSSWTLTTQEPRGPDYDDVMCAYVWVRGCVRACVCVTLLSPPHSCDTSRHWAPSLQKRTLLLFSRCPLTS